MDISESMLEEANANCRTRGLNNVEFLKSDDDLSLLHGKYDFIHSFIVFQHIPVERGERILANFFAHLEDEGICVLHFTYADSQQVKNFARSLIMKYIPLAKNFINLVKGRGFFYPTMQMNKYNLNKLFYILQQKNVRNFFIEFTDHGGYLGVILFFKKPIER
jgi:cyclopropane fatty-acyl-phospholipid synthase-like methyltransferase